ncbi:Wzz/FepE/Etk N-terminal domain-containing protein [Henriciella sp.]|uniref:GumC family protein n=1 Tax=Henriciella sp. TaxID=1968823 RepID=UPI002635C4A3|nr:Wzz/FepE/Etk N-terminal domain-containing protein [Henriciella sp.]
MASTGDWGAAGSDHAGTGVVRHRPRLGAVEIGLQLWRAKWVMLLVFIPIFVLGILAALQMPTTYEANSRLYVRLGDENVYRPRVGTEGAGAMPETEQLIQAEIEVLRSPIVAERALEGFSVARVFPELHEATQEKLAEAPASQHAAIEEKGYEQAVAALREAFETGSAPKTPVIGTALTHKDATLSAELLNAIVAAYLEYRTEVFSSSSSASLAGQREKFEAQLLDVEDDIRAFLKRHDIGDFESERQTAQQLYATINSELLTNQSRASAVEGQLDIYNRQLASMDPQQDLYVEDSSAERLTELQVEREELLSRYTEDSRAVQAVDQRIAQLREYLQSRQGLSGTTRRGPNPVYQEIEQSANNLEAEAQSLALQEDELERQLERVEARLERLNDLAPQWQELQRRKSLMEANVENFSVRELEERALSEISDTSAESVRVLEPARTPIEGSSLKLPIAALAFLFAGFTAFMAGLLRALTRQGFPTARSVERTVGVPVVGSLKKAA